MSTHRSIRGGLAAAVAAVVLSGSPNGPTSAVAAEALLLKSIQPGSARHVFHTRLATMMQKYGGREIQISLGTAPPRMLVQVATGKADLAFSAPTIIWFMQHRKAMYAKMASAPELAKNIRGVINHGGGTYQFVVLASSGIKSMKDFKGKTVQLAIPGGVAYRVMAGMVQAATGYKPNVDYKASKLDLQAASQAFMDKNIDVFATPAAIPDPEIEQFALTNKIRIIGIPDKAFESAGIKAVLRFPGRFRLSIKPHTYGSNQVNTAPVKTLGTTESLVTNKNVSEEAIYQLTKILWEHIGEIVKGSKSLPNAFNKKMALHAMNVPLHAGAYRYYKEAGFDIPASLKPPEAK